MTLIRIAMTNISGDARTRKSVPNNKSKILEEAKSAEVPTLHFDGNSVQLGRLCNKPFRISALSLKIGKENEIQEILNEFGKK